MAFSSSRSLRALMFTTCLLRSVVIRWLSFGIVFLVYWYRLSLSCFIYTKVFEPFGPTGDGKLGTMGDAELQNVPSLWKNFLLARGWGLINKNLSRIRARDRGSYFQWYPKGYHQSSRNSLAELKFSKWDNKKN